MKLPDAENSFVPETKITEYLLNADHPNGRGKAQFFRQFGFSMSQWEQLAEALVTHAQTHEIIKSEQTRFGIRYVIEGKLDTPIGRMPNVRSVWFIEQIGQPARLVTAYPLEDEND